MDKNSQIGELLEKGQTTVTNAVGDSANIVKAQVLGDEKKPKTLVNPANSQQPSELIPPEQLQAQEHTREAVKDFYAPSEDLPLPPQPGESDEQKLTKIRQELQGQKSKHQALHEEVYYNPLFAYEQKSTQQEQERPAEAVLRQKQQDLQQDLEKQAKKDQDIAVQRAQKHVEIKGAIAG
ncbi:MAG: hypothetical protein HYT06_01340 [Candidatus Levybacteria bacterium]|nr:hypothetical protein [Candidatus Levybacteria bacterium]